MGNDASADILLDNVSINYTPAVSAPIDLHFSKQVETFATEIELK